MIPADIAIVVALAPTVLGPKRSSELGKHLELAVCELRDILRRK